MNTSIRAIEYYLPEQTLGNDELAALFPDWPAAKIQEKTGIQTRHIAAADETATDLAVRAAMRLFDRGALKPEDVDFLLFCTQTPDYALPTSACLIQQRLGLPMSTGALDFNLGCSGYIYGLSLAKGLIETGVARNVLLLTGETYSKCMAAGDKTVRTLFGDAGSATWLSASSSDEGGTVGPFVFGTDGRGANHLIYRGAGARRLPEVAQATPGADHLYMNGPAILTFTMQVVPDTVSRLLALGQVSSNDVDYFVFHQANRFVMDVLRDRCKIPLSKFPVDLLDKGNTVSNTIPITLRDMSLEGKLDVARRVMLVGFGVGLSWGGCLATLPPRL